ncbi:UvrD-helicase domain-containing protein [Parenemella sanctibonifatiensis]|uniref:RecBCD enzyme subunit RecB n=1 Tax=Parenemella sanctibonifatiensis TaxID=2016505 RepID=A0A255E5T0_9ACTN|nr:UvrD-helicase domain-containing protein [Parenemella sanctibonifatiensis]OYN86650.1 hypothetical protein CGZ92_10025 [Parenemella sanctibonifatiensis]
MTSAPVLHPTSFDLAGELPTGTTVLEASAGTGKTYAIAALATRIVAEGRATLPQIMIATFSTAATSELRDRVRALMREMEHHLAADGLPEAPLPRLLCDVDPGERQRRLDRLRAALASFDRATIETTHGFCSGMLRGLGVYADADPQSTLAAELTELARVTADDLFLQRWGNSSDLPAFTVATARHLAVEAIKARSVALAPGQHPVREGFVNAVRSRVESRRRRAGLQSYDDLLLDLQTTLAAPTIGEAAAQRIADRFPVVLVDEFQDTDPVQWDILRTAFHGRSTLVLIGDPKQAIYAFRGAEVNSYLEATQLPGVRHATLDTNWRSDAALVSALGTFLNGADLGDSRIRVRHVQAAQPSSRLRRGEADAAPVRLRVHRPLEGNSSRRAVDADVVEQILGLLSGHTLTSGSDDSARERPLAPQDIAVLVGSNKRATAITRSLTAAGIAAVQFGADSPFTSPAAEDWRTLIDALENPQANAVRTLAMTPFFGWRWQDLAQADEVALAELSSTVQEWAAALHGSGIGGLWHAIQRFRPHHGPYAELVLEQRVDPDTRWFTDAQQLASELIGGETHHASNAAELRDRLDRGKRVEDGIKAQLSDDTPGVNVMTIHRSKGLEFPVVLLPDLCEGWGWDKAKDTKVVKVHVEGTRVMDLGGGQRSAQYQAQAQQEDHGERLRKAYVALTRARSQVVLWWAQTGNLGSSPLHRLLTREPDGPVPVPADAAGIPPARLQQAQAWAEVSSVPLEPPAPTSLGGSHEPSGEHHEVHARPFTRWIDHTWRRTSYSGLTADAHHDVPTVVDAPVAEPGSGGMDEPETSVAAGPDLPAPWYEASPMAELPGGTEFGLIVHEICEHLDLSAAATPTEQADLMTAAVTEHLHRHPIADLTADELAPPLLQVMRTPLGPVAEGVSLAEVTSRDRLAELDFEMPLGGPDGSTPAPAATLAAIADLLRSELPAQDPLVHYADDLATLPGADEALRGYLTGSIDIVLRTPTGRFVVADYKTNRLASPGTDLTFAHYTMPAMATAMRSSHYPLQALLYQAALHRFLRWRLPDYDPERHLGGVLYLFVRGMAGPDTPTADGLPAGVMSWQPPVNIAVGISDLLAAHPGGAA